MQKELASVPERPVDLITRRVIEHSANAIRREAILSAAQVIDRTTSSTCGCSSNPRKRIGRAQVDHVALDCAKKKAYPVRVTGGVALASKSRIRDGHRCSSMPTPSISADMAISAGT